MMIYSEILTDLLIGKCFLTQILANLHNKSYFQEKTKYKIIQPKLKHVQIERSSYQKHFGITLDEKLNFKQHIDGAVSQVTKDISVINNFNTFCHENH